MAKNKKIYKGKPSVSMQINFNTDNHQRSIGTYADKLETELDGNLCNRVSPFLSFDFPSDPDTSSSQKLQHDPHYGKYTDNSNFPFKMNQRASIFPDQIQQTQFVNNGNPQLSCSNLQQNLTLPGNTIKMSNIVNLNSVDGQSFHFNSENRIKDNVYRQFFGELDLSNLELSALYDSSYCESENNLINYKQKLKDNVITAQETLLCRTPITPVESNTRNVTTEHSILSNNSHVKVQDNSLFNGLDKKCNRIDTPVKGSSPNVVDQLPERAQRGAEYTGTSNQHKSSAFVKDNYINSSPKLEINLSVSQVKPAPPKIEAPQKRNISLQRKIDTINKSARKIKLLRPKYDGFQHSRRRLKTKSQIFVKHINKITSQHELFTDHEILSHAELDLDIISLSLLGNSLDVLRSSKPEETTYKRSTFVSPIPRLPHNDNTSFQLAPPVCETRTMPVHKAESSFDLRNTITNPNSLTNHNFEVKRPPSRPFRGRFQQQATCLPYKSHVFEYPNPRKVEDDAISLFAESNFGLENSPDRDFSDSDEKTDDNIPNDVFNQIQVTSNIRTSVSPLENYVNKSYSIMKKSPINRLISTISDNNERLNDLLKAISPNNLSSLNVPEASSTPNTSLVKTLPNFSPEMLECQNIKNAVTNFQVPENVLKHDKTSYDSEKICEANVSATVNSLQSEESFTPLTGENEPSDNVHKRQTVQKSEILVSHCAVKQEDKKMYNKMVAPIVNGYYPPFKNASVSSNTDEFYTKFKNVCNEYLSAGRCRTDTCSSMHKIPNDLENLLKKLTQQEMVHIYKTFISNYNHLSETLFLTVVKFLGLCGCQEELFQMANTIPHLSQASDKHVCITSVVDALGDTYMESKQALERLISTFGTSNANMLDILLEIILHEESIINNWDLIKKLTQVNGYEMSLKHVELILKNCCNQKSRKRYYVHNVYRDVITKIATINLQKIAFEINSFIILMETVDLKEEATDLRKKLTAKPQLSNMYPYKIFNDPNKNKPSSKTTPVAQLLTQPDHYFKRPQLNKIKNNPKNIRTDSRPNYHQQTPSTFDTKTFPPGPKIIFDHKRLPPPLGFVPANSFTSAPPGISKPMKNWHGKSFRQRNKFSADETKVWPYPLPPDSNIPKTQTQPPICNFNYPPPQVPNYSQEYPSTNNVYLTHNKPVHPNSQMPSTLQSDISKIKAALSNSDIQFSVNLLKKYQNRSDFDEIINMLVSTIDPKCAQALRQMAISQIKDKLDT